MASNEKTDELPPPALLSSARASPTINEHVSLVDKLRSNFMMEVIPEQSTFPLAMYCFMTGFIDAAPFTAIFVWCGFQTGNTVQLSLALARLFSGPVHLRDFSFHLADKQALTSLTTFLGGAFIGRLGDKIGAKTRAWLFLGTMIQALFTMAAAIAIWKSKESSVADSRDDPSWTNTLSFVAVGFVSASLGLQGIMGKRVNSQFATTIVLTTVWCELMADPKLFKRGWIVTRDHKIIGVVALFIGGFLSRALVDKIGAAGTFGVGTGIRVAIALSWFFVPAKVKK